MGLFKRDERLPDLGIQLGLPGQKGRVSLDEAFAKGRKEGRALLMPFLVCGYPDGDQFLRCVEAAAIAGADVAEIGIPFSDPIMDGPVIARASTQVLSGGQTLDQAFSLLERASAAFGGPIVAMTYYNLLLHRGLGMFASACASAGVDAVIVPDLTPEESLQWSVACQQSGVKSVYLAAPTSSDERLRRITQASEGFIYAASTLGVTGVRDVISDRAQDLVRRIRDVTDKPVAVGIGVSTAEHVARVATYADGVIVGSALVKAIDAAPADPADAVSSLVTSLRSAVGAGS